MLNNWWGRQNAAPLKFDSKTSEAAFFGRFSKFDKCQSAIAGEVKSSVVIDWVGRGVRVTCGRSELNSG